MKFEEQVTSVELSNRLLELGVRKPSLFFREWTGAKQDEIQMWDDINGDVCLDNVNCYTVAELGEMLPRGEVLPYRLETGSKPTWYSSKHLPEDGPSDMDRSTIQESTEANARAKMLIYLLENGLASV
jgi:hypothetical protein